MKKLLFVFVVLSLLLAACGGPAAPAATEAPAAPVEIRVWGHQAPAFNEADQKIFDVERNRPKTRAKALADGAGLGAEEAAGHLGAGGSQQRQAVGRQPGGAEKSRLQRRRVGADRVHPCIVK